MGTRSQSVTSISVSGDILDKQWGKLRGQQVDSGDCGALGRHGRRRHPCYERLCGVARYRTAMC